MLYQVLFMRVVQIGVILYTSLTWLQASERPNVILMMADDLGYGDVGFNGNEIIQTPHLDKMAASGTTLTHFYAGNSVCSPTRATVLTGRHHHRLGIFNANVGHLPKQEVTLASMLKESGYTTGHFGKWHLGTLSKTISSKGVRRKPLINFAPPWERSYDYSFVTESAVRTWDPGLGQRAENNAFYENGIAIDANAESLLGGAARVVVDRAVPFIERAVSKNQPFLAVVWFHAPHEDVAAGPEYLEMYQNHGDAAHYFGCITEMDEQVGRIQSTLNRLGVADDTLIFFCSDNGPEGKEQKGRRQGVTNGLRERKRSLYDGGVRVPAFAVWPSQITAGTENGDPLSTLDYFPTVQNLMNYTMPDDRPIDGQDILPILTGKTDQRTKAIPFVRSGQSALVKGHYKLVMPKGELYDLSNDWGETNDIAAASPEIVDGMQRELRAYLTSFEASHSGADYNDPSFKPVDKWKAIK